MKCKHDLDRMFKNKCYVSFTPLKYLFENMKRRLAVCLGFCTRKNYTRVDGQAYLLRQIVKIFSNLEQSA